MNRRRVLAVLAGGLSGGCLNLTRSPSAGTTRTATTVANTDRRETTAESSPQQATQRPPEVGGLRWRFRTRAPFAFDATPQLLDDTVYAASQDNRVYALDRDTGALQWTYEGGEFALSVTTEHVFAGSFGTVVALDPATGTEQWRNGVGTRWAPVAADETLYAGDTTIAALDPSSGTAQWSVETAGPTMGRPTVVDGTLCIASNVGTTHPAEEGVLYGLDPADGTVQWERRTDRPFVSPTVGSDGVAFVSSSVNNEDTDVVHAFDAATGEARWTHRFEGDGWIRRSQLLYTGEHLLVHGDRVYALDPSSGDRRWTGDFQPRWGRLHDGVAHYYDSSTYRVVDPATGAVQRSFEFQDVTVSDPTPPAVGPDTTYFGGEDGYLRAVWRRGD